MGAGCGAAAAVKPGKVENALTRAERDALVVGGPFRGGTARGVMPLCRTWAKAHAARVLADRGRAFELDDLEADALAAAVEAARYFDPDAGTAFTTYAGAFVAKALLTATDERHKPEVHGWPADDPDGDRFDPADRDDHEPDDLDHFGFLTADQRATFDLIPEGKGKDVIRLMLRGYDVGQIAAQTGTPRKDVLLSVRNAVSHLRKLGVVPADLEPHPKEAAMEAEAWEREKAKNRDAAARAELNAEVRARCERVRQERAVRQAAQQAANERISRLADRLRPLLAETPGAKNAELAERLKERTGHEASVGDVGKACQKFKLRAKREKAAAAATGGEGGECGPVMAANLPATVCVGQ